ncbi:MAG: CHRD domain-containing protein [Bacteroidota bacterium]
MIRIQLVIFLYIMMVAGACKKDEVIIAPTKINFTSVLNGANEPRPVTTSATGTATAEFDTQTKILTVTVIYSGMVATSGNIHRGKPGETGTIIFPFSVTTSPITYRSTGLPPAKEADLLNNLYYINLKSAANITGEIRGQLIKQ